MKKLTLLMMACCMALVAYAQPWTITYNLPAGAVTNDYGWQDKWDMLTTFTDDWNTLTGQSRTWGTPTDTPPDINGQTFGADNVAHVLSLFADNPAARWFWLREYIIAANEAQGLTVAATDMTALTGSAAVFFRSNVDAFFNSRHVAVGSWNVSANFAAIGASTIEAFQSAWGGGFDGPAEYDGTEEIVLPAPFMEGESFLGWFTPAGVRMNVIPVGHEGNLVLEARFGDFVFPVREVLDTVPGTEIRTGGTVTLVDGNTVFFQDVSGVAITAVFAAAPDVVAYDNIVLVGTVAALGSTVRLENITLESKEVGTRPQAFAVSALSALNNNKFRLVYLPSVVVTSFSAGVAEITDGLTTATIAVPNLPAGVSVGNRVSVTANVTYDGTNLGLIASPSNIARVAAISAERWGNGAGALVIYDDMDEDFSFRNVWLVSHTMSNRTENPLGGDSRAMVTKDGLMYFADRTNNRLIVVDAETGERLDAISFPGVFTNVNNVLDATGEVPLPVGLPFNDLKLDGAGNLIASNLITSAGGLFQVWRLDLDNPANSHLILEGVISQIPGFGAYTVRLDYIGVWGDMTGDGYILAANGLSMDVLRWDVSNGTASMNDLQMTYLDTDTPDSPLFGASPGTATQVLPVAENLFYFNAVDLTTVLVDMDGFVVDGFHNVPGYGEEDGGFVIAGRPNGMIQFSLRGDYFMAISYRNTTGLAPHSAFRLFRFADANREFSEIIPMWVFPQIGLGSVSNPGVVAIPSVEVDEEAGIARIAVLADGNGYGFFELVSTREGTSVGRIDADDALVGMFVEGNTVVFDQEVAQVSVFSVTGQLLTVGINSTEITIPATGVFLVRVVTLDGQTAVERVIIR